MRTAPSAYVVDPGLPARGWRRLRRLSRPMKRRVTSDVEVRNGRSVRRVALLALHERVRTELVSHGLPHGARAAAMDDANVRDAGERRLVDEGANGLACLLCPLAAHVELVGDVAAGRGDDAHRRRLLLPAQLLRRGAEPGQIDPDP